MCLDIKMHKKWKYKYDVCIGCGKNSETVEECNGYKDKNSDKEVKYEKILK